MLLPCFPPHLYGLFFCLPVVDDPGAHGGLGLDGGGPAAVEDHRPIAERRAPLHTSDEAIHAVDEILHVAPVDPPIASTMLREAIEPTTQPILSTRCTHESTT